MWQYSLLILLFFPRIIVYLAEKSPNRVSSDWAFLGAAGMAFCTVWAYLTGQPFGFQLISLGEYLELGLSVDVLSGMIATTVLLIGSSVMKYSVRYLEDDPNRLAFQRNLSSTLVCVLTMLASTSLIVFWLAWVGASFYLHKLLTHFSDREEAQKAAHQKFWISRLGDFFIVTASLIIFYIFGSFQFDVIAAKVADTSLIESQWVLVHVGSLLLVLGAMTKSAQFPFHFWLPQTMETPTPVSALMHAGIINAGGYLIIRMSPFLNEAPLALLALAFVGGFTAFYGSVLMLSQTNIKKTLAYSTISQMGFMMLQCGLGAFSIAVVHIIGHAFYKAYAFLGAGMTTDYGRLNRYIPKQKEELSLWTPFWVGVVGVGSMAVLGVSLGDLIDKPGAPVLLLVLGLAVSQIFLSYQNALEAMKVSVALAVSYFGLVILVTHSLEGVVINKATAVRGLEPLTYVLLAGFFVALYLIQNNLNRISKTEFGKKMYVKSLNGGFFGN